MPFLSDAFPEDFRKQFVDRTLQVGTVLRMYVTDTNPPKTKFFVVIGYSEDKIALGVVYINTEINPNVFPTEELKRLHIPLTPDERGLVETNCHIDCSKIYEKPVEHINELVAANPEYVRGQLNERETGMILATVFSARTVPRVVKRKFDIR